MRIQISLLVIGLLIGLSSCQSSSASAATADMDATVFGPGETFATPEAAMQAVGAAARADDRTRAEAIFGAGSLEVLESGDDAADRANGLRAADMIQERVAFEDLGPDRKAALIGKDAWRFSIPLVKVAGGWRFDLVAGKDELLTRRIGRNELFAIETMHACMDAQREYHQQPRDGNPIAYARRFKSTGGKHDGLFWPTGPNDQKSPVGEFLAAACPEDEGTGAADIAPFHGYYYRILTCQGPAAPGGEKTYLDQDGRLTGGCGVVAWPATYGNSGIMTFVVNHVGIVFQKDLGPATTEEASQITRYDPDATWTPVRE